MAPITDRQLRAAENAQYRMQLGIYFSKIEKIDGATILFSDTIEDVFWNYAATVNAKEENLEGLVERVVEFYRSRNRQPCIYVTPFSRPQSLSAYLRDRSFQVVFRDAWMFHEGKTSQTIIQPTDLRIKEVSSKADMGSFVKVFNQAYGGTPSENEPYGGLAAYYGEALLASFSEVQRGKRVWHYLATIGDHVVGIASLISSRGYAGIYNVGTLPEYRRKGIGALLSLRAVEDSEKQGNKVLFLQTEGGSYVERFYEKLGFSTKFVGEGYELSD